MEYMAKVVTEDVARGLTISLIIHYLRLEGSSLRTWWHRHVSDVRDDWQGHPGGR